MQTARRPVRIANFSGYYGDRAAALAEVVTGGPVDAVTGDYLAEITMVILAKARLKNAATGFARTFLEQLEPALGEIADRGTKVVVNAGGLNPRGLAEATRAVCAQLGVPLRIAHIEGDDLLPRLEALTAAGHRLEHLDDGRPLSSWDVEALTANAYLSGWGIARALESGADVVICPRVADASLTTGVAAWWHGWSSDAWDALAGAVTAGHIIECGPQATGGNFSGFTRIADLRYPGFPLAEIAADGSSVITKHPGTGGAVTVDTVTAQLVYEVQGLDYLNPDATVHLDTVELRAAGEDQVAVSGVRGGPPPSTLKVAITGMGGHSNSTTYVFTGLDVDKKAELVEAMVRHRLADVAGIEELRFELIGRPVDDPPTQLAASALFKVSVRGDEAAVGRRFSTRLAEMGLASYPGLYATSPPTGARAYGAHWPALIPRELVPQRVFLDDGTEHLVEAGPCAPVSPRRSAAAEPGSRDWGPTERVALGRLVDARSGDKGGNANLGVWAHDDRSYAWLQMTLTSGRLQELLPEARGHTVDRYVLPKLRALNFVIRGHLDEGCTSTLQFDTQAKGLGEYLRARHVDIPTELLEG